MRSMMLLTLVCSSACVPNNATLQEGDFAVFLASSTSKTLTDDKIDLDAGSEAARHYTVDCVGGDKQLKKALDICGDANWPPTHEAWLSRDAYHVYTDTLEPWRGEAIMTSEGDFQVTFHQALTGGEDFRFAFVIDPVFQPKKCVQSEEGSTVMEPVDGLWLENWSADVDAGTLYYLNSAAYQFNPSELDEVWGLPNEWFAGFATAKFGPEEFYLRGVRYGEPSFYSRFEAEEVTEPSPDELFYQAMNAGVDPTTSTAFQSLIADVEEISEQTTAELALVELPAVRTKVHTNEWRAPDGRAAGLDSWVELHYNWVRMDASSTLVVGASASGEFNLTFDAAESQSRLFIQGSFVVDEIKADRWVTDDIQAIKLEENGTVLCDE